MTPQQASDYQAAFHREWGRYDMLGPIVTKEMAAAHALADIERAFGKKN